MSPDPPLANEIITLLQQTKRAQTITKISQVLGHDRRTISNILNHLLIAQKVEMIQHGQKKKFYLRDNPNTIIQLQSPSINQYEPLFLIINSNVTIRWANSVCIQNLQVPLNILVGKSLLTLDCPLLNNPTIISHIKNLPSGDSCTFEESLEYNEENKVFRYTLASLTLSDKDQVIILTGYDITSIKEIEMNVVKQEHQLKLLTENIPGAVFRRHLPTNRIEFFNSMFQLFAGHLSKKYDNGSVNIIDSCIYPEDREAYVNALQFSLLTCNEYEVEYRILNRDGEERFLLERGRPIKNESGETNYFDGFILDITERKVIENLLQESEERFRLLANLAPVGIYITDTTGTCQYTNREWCRQTGLTHEEAVERGWIFGTNSATMESQDTNRQKSDHNIGQWVHQYSFLTKKGVETWVQTTTAELKNRNGEVIGFIGCNTDITEQKEREEKIRERDKINLQLFEKNIMSHIDSPTQGGQSFLGGSWSSPDPNQWVNIDNDSRLLHKIGDIQNQETLPNLSPGLVSLPDNSKKSDNNYNYRELYESIPVGYIALDRNGTICESNSIANTLLSSNELPVIGKPLQHFISEDSISQFVIFLSQLQTAEKSLSCRVSLVRRGLPSIPVLLKGMHAAMNTSQRLLIRLAIINA